MRAKVLIGLVGALLAAVALASASGAATAKAQKVTRIDVSTRAAVINYLQSIHVNPKGVVIQRGGLNYAGARCPGVRWTCASTKHTVVQIAERGGQNRFACRSAHCVVVQISGSSGGVYISGRQLASTAASTKGGGGGSTAVCVKTGSGATTGSGQSCAISQSGSGPNTAGIYQNTQKVSGLVQSAQYIASITQQSTGSNNNTACVTQVISLDGSAANTNGKPTTANLQAHQSIMISQNNSGTGTGNNAATNSAQYAATSTGACNTSSSLTQSQTLTSTVTATGPITQNEDTTYSPCGDGIVGDYANLCLKIDQNQGSAFKCTSSTSCPSSTTNVAIFTQSSTQTAVANATKGAAVSQQQSAPACPASGAPSNCVAGSGLVGTINQDSSGNSTATPTQNEVQCQDAAISGLNSCSTTPDSPNFLPGRLTQKQYGPVTVGNLPIHHKGRVVFSHLKGLGQARQAGNTTDQYTITQTSTQYADHGALQQNFGNADCTTDGFCTAAQTTTINGTSTSDGYTAPSIPALNITCGGITACVPTPPPVPTITGSPPLDTSSRTTSKNATFEFTDPATDATFTCNLDGTDLPDCGSPTVIHKLADGTQTYMGLSYGTHHFKVQAVDQSGNPSAYTAMFTWTIVPPDPTIETNPLDPATYGTSTFTFSDADPGVHYQCKIDSNTPTACNSGSITYSGSTVLSSGQHTFSVRAYDTTDAVASVNAATYTWVITPPDPTITPSSEPGDPDFSGNSYTFAFTDADSTVHYQCQIDSNPVTSCNSGSSQTYSGLAPGSHTFSVTAYDQSEAYPSDNPATFTWTILALSVDALGGDGSAAGWACQHGGPIGLTLGTDTANTFAEIDLTDVGGTAINGLSEPTFATDNYAAGSPRYYITLDNNHSLWGYPPNAGLNGPDFAWAIDNGNTYQSWNAVQSAEAGATVTGASVIADGDQAAGTTDEIGNLQFDGTTFNSGTCS